MKNTKRFGFKAIICVIAAALLCALLMCAAFADTGSVGEITSVKLNKSHSELDIEISLTKEFVKANKSKEFYIFELLPHESEVDVNSLEPVKKFKANKSVSVKIPFYEGNANRLYSRFVVAVAGENGEYSVVTDAKYVENITSLAKNTAPYPEKTSKKGLGVQMFTDAQQLGVAHTVMNVAINEYLHGEGSDAANSFVYNGQSFYVDKAKIALLDHKVKTYTDAGINVYFNIILTAPKADEHPNIAALYCDGISPDAALYAPNTKNETAMKSYQAFVDYLASRYTRADGAYGLVPAFIVGFEVNSNRVWNNSDATTLTDLVDSYCTVFRVAYTAMMSHYSNGRVYVSLGNNFNTQTGGTSDEENALVDYPSRAFLDVFAETVKASGDIPWGLSVNPYPSSPEIKQFWTDEMATDSVETPYITVKNLNVLTRYMASDALLYNSEIRSVMVGELGFSGNPASDDEMTVQAAAYALAYYSIEQNADIDAFIYHRHVDHAAETQYYGLWTNEEGSASQPLAKKPIYNVFSLIDTAKSEEVTAFVKQSVGDEIYSEFVAEGVKYKQFDDRTVIEGAQAEATDIKRSYKDKVLFDFNGGSLCGFYPTDGAQYVELRSFGDAAETMLYAKLPDMPSGYVGIGTSVFEEGALEKMYYMTLRVMAATPAGVGPMTLTLRLQDNGDFHTDSTVWEAKVTVTPNEWGDIVFDIEEFSEKTDGEIDLMKIWVSTDSGEPISGEYGIRLESVTLHGKKPMGGIGWTFTVLLILVLLVIAGYGALVLRARYIRRKRREAAHRRQMIEAERMRAQRAQYPPQYRR